MMRTARAAEEEERCFVMLNTTTIYAQISSTVQRRRWNSTIVMIIHITTNIKKKFKKITTLAHIIEPNGTQITVFAFIYLIAILKTE